MANGEGTAHDGNLSFGLELCSCILVINESACWCFLERSILSGENPMHGVHAFRARYLSGELSSSEVEF